MKIAWSRIAEETFNDELDFIFKKWGHKEVERFIALVEDFIKTLESGILKGKSSKKFNAQFSVISKQTTLVYRINKQNEHIELLLFWNNKRNPAEFEKYLR